MSRWCWTQVLCPTIPPLAEAYPALSQRAQIESWALWPLDILVWTELSG